MKSLYELAETSSELLKRGNIKSMQTGTTNVATANTAVNVTVSVVDITKTIVLPRSNRNASDYLALTSPTNLQVNSTATGNVSWQIVEFY